MLGRRFARKVVVIALGPLVRLWGICGLILVMTLKHFVADFVLQTNWIARGKERRTGWSAPLAIHVLIHAAFALAIALAVAPRLWWLAFVDLVVHAAIDRGKSLVAQWGRWDTTNAKFWWLLGFDQFLHQVTNVMLAAALLSL